MITDPKVARSIAKQIASMHDAFDLGAQPCLSDLPQAKGYYDALQSQLRREQAEFLDLAEHLESQRGNHAES